MSEVKKDLIFKHFKENPKEYWDKRSSSFFKMLQNDVENESKVILEVLKEKNLKENLKVLDLGCGFGRHIKFFQEISKECIGLDISEEMLKLAKKYVPNKDVSNFYCIDWDKEDYSLQNKERFSLVFSSMCQALDTKENIKKFIRCSNNYCMVERFLSEDNPLTELLPDIDKNKPNNDWEYSRDLINLLWNLGYYPESKIYSYNKKCKLTSDSLEYQEINKLNLNNKLLNEIKREIEVNGIYTYNKYTVKILIFWSVKEIRKL